MGTEHRLGHGQVSRGAELELQTYLWGFLSSPLPKIPVLLAGFETWWLQLHQEVNLGYQHFS